MATHSSILAWRIPKDSGAWWATVLELHRVGHDYQLSTHIVDRRRSQYLHSSPLTPQPEL